MSEADRLQRDIDSSFDELQLHLAIHRARLNGLADVGRPPSETYEEFVDESAWWAHVARLILVGVAAGLLIVAVCFLAWRLV
jgi:hypothetical protein